MKTIKITYLETYHVTEERIMEVSDAMYKKLQDENSIEHQRLIEKMDSVTCFGESHTQRDITDLCVEIATPAQEDAFFTLDF